MAFLTLIGMLVILWCMIWFFVGLGNDNAWGGRDNSHNNTGCTLMIFVPIVIGLLLKALFGL